MVPEASVTEKGIYSHSKCNFHLRAANGLGVVWNDVCAALVKDGIVRTPVLFIKFILYNASLFDFDLLLFC